MCVEFYLQVSRLVSALYLGYGIVYCKRVKRAEKQQEVLEAPLEAFSLRTRLEKQVEAAPQQLSAYLTEADNIRKMFWEGSGGLTEWADLPHGPNHLEYGKGVDQILIASLARILNGGEDVPEGKYEANRHALTGKEFHRWDRRGDGPDLHDRWLELEKINNERHVPKHLRPPRPPPGVYAQYPGQPDGRLTPYRDLDIDEFLNRRRVPAEMIAALAEAGVYPQLKAELNKGLTTGPPDKLTDSELAEMDRVLSQPGTSVHHAQIQKAIAASRSGEPPPILMAKQPATPSTPLTAKQPATPSPPSRRQLPRAQTA